VSTNFFAVIFKPGPYKTPIYNIIMNKLFFWFKMFTLFCLLLMSSCKDENLSNHVDYGNMNIYIEYLDSNGANILQNDTPVAVFYEKDGIPQPVVRLNFDRPYGFTITSKSDISPKPTNELRVVFFPSDYMDNENLSTTYIKLGNNSMDTFRCLFYKDQHVIFLLKVWCNGTLVYDSKTASTSSPLIKIVK